ARAAHGWNPAAYAALLGVEYRPPATLPPDELSRRLDRILDAAEVLLRNAPDAWLASVPSERDRSVRDLGFHVFRLSLAFIDGMDLGRFPERWLQETPPAALQDGHALASYGALVRARIGGWFEGTDTGEYARMIDVYYGPQSGHDLLERTTWHAAQHLRQLYVLAERAGLTPPVPLPTDAFRDLPLPDALW
ncbi:MAG: DinB family protein, partial [Candidatus Rokuibacteriota bacterium]